MQDIHFSFIAVSQSVQAYVLAELGSVSPVFVATLESDNWENSWLELGHPESGVNNSTDDVSTSDITDNASLIADFWDKSTLASLFDEKSTTFWSISIFTFDDDWTLLSCKSIFDIEDWESWLDEFLCLYFRGRGG